MKTLFTLHQASSVCDDRCPQRGKHRGSLMCNYPSPPSVKRLVFGPGGQAWTSALAGALARICMSQAGGYQLLLGTVWEPRAARAARAARHTTIPGFATIWSTFPTFFSLQFSVYRSGDENLVHRDARKICSAKTMNVRWNLSQLAQA